MPVRLTEFFAGECYHIYHRGANGQRIFFDTENYYYFMRLIRKNAQRFQINVLAFCLLPNHFHFLLQPNLSGNLSTFMGRLQQSYVQAINKRYKRSGPLFYERFQDKHVPTERYEILVCRYIHSNPIKHRIVNDLNKWLYSNYFEFIGVRDREAHLLGYREKFFPNAHDYVNFVAAYGTQEDKELEQWLNS